MQLSYHIIISNLMTLNLSSSQKTASDLILYYFIISLLFCPQEEIILVHIIYNKANILNMILA